MDKAQIHRLFLKELEKVYNNAVSAAQQAHASATHSESVAENKYDTFGLESAYLAHGQSQRVMQYQTELLTLKNMKLSEFNADTPIALSAIVLLQDQNSSEKIVFLGPAGGHSIIEGGKSIALISVSSPLGRKLLGCYEGDSVTVLIGDAKKHFEILTVS